ncbi:MAG: DUF1294 domain-containing protein [Candidatus Omnitrophica bacterium]|nr:DUF1294 domain-containing protein [Candidatus Omnitrophota bacterium]
MTVLLWYVFIINVGTFAAYGLDKWQARRHGRRISEKKLLGLVVIGGTIGAWLGRQGFRHKTQKTSFRILFWLIALVQLGLIVGMYWIRFA